MTKTNCVYCAVRNETQTIIQGSNYGLLKRQPRSPVVKSETLRFTNEGFPLTTEKKQKEGTETLVSEAGQWQCTYDPESN
jgi:hypothetical protein